MSNSVKDPFQVLENKVIELGAYALSQQASLINITSKGSLDWVTEVDQNIDAHLRTHMNEYFPHSSILSEELGGKSGTDETYWMIDPLDGTINYMQGIPFWAISLALYTKGKPTYAFCHLPALNETFTARAGQGAFLNNQPIQVSARLQASQAVVSMGDYNIGDTAIIPQINHTNIKLQQNLVNNFARVKCMGSAVVESCFVACGRLDAFAMIYSHPWDIAPGILLVTEAGGQASTPLNQPWDLSDGAALAFSNGSLHPALLSCYPLSSVQELLSNH